MAPSRLLALLALLPLSSEAANPRRFQGRNLTLRGKTLPGLPRNLLPTGNGALTRVETVAGPATSLLQTTQKARRLAEERAPILEAIAGQGGSLETQRGLGDALFEPGTALSAPVDGSAGGGGSRLTPSSGEGSGGSVRPPAPRRSPRRLAQA